MMAVRPSADDRAAALAIDQVREQGMVLVLDTWGYKNKIEWSEEKGCFVQYGTAREEFPYCYTTCDEEHVRDDIEEYGIREMLGSEERFACGDEL